MRVLDDVVDAFLHDAIDVDLRVIHKQGVNVVNLGSRVNIGHFVDPHKNPVKRLAQTETADLKRPQIIGDFADLFDG